MEKKTINNKDLTIICVRLKNKNNMDLAPWKANEILTNRGHQWRIDTMLVPWRVWLGCIKGGRKIRNAPQFWIPPRNLQKNLGFSSLAP
jgi:hypothetical protein